MSMAQLLYNIFNVQKSYQQFSLGHPLLETAASPRWYLLASALLWKLIQSTHVEKMKVNLIYVL